MDKLETSEDTALAAYYGALTQNNIFPVIVDGDDKF